MQLIDPKFAVFGRSKYLRLRLGRLLISLILGAIAGVLVLALLVMGLYAFNDTEPSPSDSTSFGLFDLPLLVYEFLTMGFFLFLIFAVALIVFGMPLLWLADRLKLRGWLVAVVLGSIAPNVALFFLNGFALSDIGLTVFSAIWGMFVGLFIWYVAFERPYRKAAKTG